MSRLLIAEEVCQQIRMSTDWLYGEVRAGRFPAVRAGRRVRFRQEDVDAWINANVVGAFPAHRRTDAAA